MATPNVVTKESPDTQWTGYGRGVVKTGSDAKGHARQVPTRSGWATV